MGKKESRKLAKEQPHQKKAFERYYELGEKRSYEKVADELGVAVSTVKLWGKSFNWTERVQDRDLQVTREVADRTVDDLASRRTRGLKIVQFALAQLTKAIAEGRVAMRMSDLERLIHLEEYLSDDPSGEEELEFLRSIGFGSQGKDDSGC